MGHQNCCVVNCKSTGRKEKRKFYKFPVASWKLNQRIKWIAAVKRKNVDGSPWYPKPYDVICSDHFLGGKKSEVESSPSYVPTIFPSVYKRCKINESSVLNRQKRWEERTIKKKIASTMPTKSVLNITEPSTDNLPDVFFERKLDRECQANIYFNSNESSNTFICNRYVTDKICDAQIQTEIFENSRAMVITNNKKFVDKECGGPHKTFVDQESQTNNIFAGFLSITKDDKLIDLAGVTFDMSQVLSSEELQTKENIKLETQSEEVEDVEFNLEDLHHSIDIKDESDSELLSAEEETTRKRNSSF